jgi:acetyltransferase-like isoleucine patch superfamily enzyme
MSLAVKIRRGQGPLWGPVKRLAKGVLRCHVPVAAWNRPLFRLLYGLHVGLREGWIWATRFFWYEPLFRGQCAAVGPGLQMEQLPYLFGSGRIELGEGVRLSGKSTFGFSNRLCDRPLLRVGDHTFIGHNCNFAVAAEVTLGSHCLLASNVQVFDYDGHSIDAAKRRWNEPFPPENCKPVAIGDDVWLGTGVLVLKGVTVGDRSIVAAGSVVTRDVPPDVIVAGNPARVVKQLTAPGGV